MHDDDTLTGLDKAGRARQHRGGRPVFSGQGAIYHLNVRTGSRSKGQSARAAAAYIQREAEYGRDRETADELLYTASGHMPAWAEAEPMTYWDAADLHERANGRLFQRVEVALPTALTAAEQRELAVGFARHLTDGEQLPYTLAIHAGEGTNPHCHLLISERTNDGLERSPEQWFRRYNAAEPEQGGARKTTALQSKAWLVETREAWAEQTNQALERAGHEIRIDHRSLEAQGIERLPSLHLGPTVAAMEARGIETERGAEVRRREQVNAQLLELTTVKEELVYERATRTESERGVDGPAPGIEESAAGASGLAPGRGGRAGHGAEAGRAAGDDIGLPDAGRPGPDGEDRPSVGPAPGTGSATPRQADDPGADLAGGDAAGVERGSSGYPGGRVPDDGPDRRDADVGEVAERTGVTRWRERIAAAREEAQEQERAARERARQEREEARQRERERERARERDEDLEWER